jgi:hypothetical protein
MFWLWLYSSATRLHAAAANVHESICKLQCGLAAAAALWAAMSGEGKYVLMCGEEETKCALCDNLILLIKSNLNFYFL